MNFSFHPMSSEELLNFSLRITPAYSMWYHDRIKAKLWTGQKVKWVQPKYDGHRITAFIQPDGRIGIFGRSFYGTNGSLRNLTPSLKWHSIIEVLKRLPGKTSVDGELFIEGGTSSDVTTAIKEQNPALKFLPFACPVFEGKDWSKRSLLDVARDFNSLGIYFAPTFEYANESETELLRTFLNNGYEGAILKAEHYGNWYKLKGCYTADCVVTGILAGEGKYLGQCGSLLISIYDENKLLVEVGAVSGMTDDQRRSISDKDIGRVVEVEYQMVASGGRLRHPRFVRFRDDKPADQCLMEQLR